MKQLLIVEPNSISSKDKEKLTKNGIIVIEHKEPDKVRIVQTTDGTSNELLLFAAMEALGSIDSEAKFAKGVSKRILSTETKNNKL